MGGAKAFQAPTSNRTAAADRMRAHGRGPEYSVSPRDSVPSSPAPMMQPAGTRPPNRRADERENDRNLNLSGMPMSPSVSDARLSAHRVNITLSDGRRILVEGATGLSAVLALVEGLMV